MRIWTAFFLFFAIFAANATSWSSAAPEAGPQGSLETVARADHGTNSPKQFPLIGLHDEIVSQAVPVSGPCKGGDDCQFLAPSTQMPSTMFEPQHGQKMAPRNRPHHDGKLIRPPIG